jgi:hypothetical protein
MSTNTSNPSWGPWILMSNETLQLYLEGSWTYEIDLQGCRSSAALLDFVCQIAGKAWATPDVVGHMVIALNQTLLPQAFLCSGCSYTTHLGYTIAPDQVSNLVERRIEEKGGR